MPRATPRSKTPDGDVLITGGIGVSASGPITPIRTASLWVPDVGTR